jgi:hypothetical protein
MAVDTARKITNILFAPGGEILPDFRNRERPREGSICSERTKLRERIKGLNSSMVYEIVHRKALLWDPGVTLHRMKNDR